MKTAVIGANGFLGTYLMKVLERKKENILAVYNRNKNKIPAHIEAISFLEFLENKQKIDNVIFAAGNFDNSVEENVRLNCEVLYPVTRLYSTCRMVYVSSSNVYGNSKKAITENSEYSRPTAYGMAKLGGEFIVSSMDSYTIIRLVYLYGKGLNNGSFFPFIIDQATTKKHIKLFGQGLRERDYLHVEDAAELCIKALFKAGNEVYLGATGNSKKNIEVAKTIQEVMGDAIEIDFVDQEENKPSFYFDPSWTKNNLDWEPMKILRNGIKEMIY